MESGINADQNFYSRSSNLPRSPLTVPSPQQDRLLPKHPDRQQYNYDADRAPFYDPTTTPPSNDLDFARTLPKLSHYNDESLVPNARVGRDVNGGGEPDEYYKGYKATQQSLIGYTSSSAGDMAATALEHRPLVSPSLRSNGNGTTAKHPLVPSIRNGTKSSSYRSPSASLDAGSSVPDPTSIPNGHSNAPKVKDLLKKFDAHPGELSALPRPFSRSVMPKKDGGAPGVVKTRAGYMVQMNHLVSSGPENRLKKMGTSTGDVNAGATPRTQRMKFAAEDQHSINVLATSPRPVRERPPPVGISSPENSRLAVNPFHKSPLSPQHAKSNTQSPKKAPLFGEVLMNEDRVSHLGYGISRDTLPTVDIHLLPALPKHNRSHSDPDREISPSPTDWYLGAPSTASLAIEPDPKIRGHNRSHSELADISANILNGVNQASVNTHPNVREEPRRVSKLPVLSPKLGPPSDASSGSSSRPNSPYQARKAAGNKLQKSFQRACSPTPRASSPSNIPKAISRPSSRIAARRNEEPKVNGSLAAYISAPAPKSSPTLRSSRPRQPVYTATTESSRRKANNKSHSPESKGTRMRVTRNAPSGPPRLYRDEDLGKAEIASAVARIKRGMTKTYNEQDQAEKRAANLKRYNERQEGDHSASTELNVEHVIPATPVESPVELTLSTPRPLRLSTSFPPAQSREAPPQVGGDADSPTLGMPGAFVDDDSYPTSAISAVTGTTEFDNEEQTEAARLRSMPSTTDSRMLQPEHPLHDVVAASSNMQNAIRISAESIQIMLESSLRDQTHNTPIRDEMTSGDVSPSPYGREPSAYDVPLAFSITKASQASPPGRQHPHILTEITLDEFDVFESPVPSSPPRGNFLHSYHPLASADGDHLDSNDRLDSPMRLHRRRSYDPYRESSPLFRPSGWTDDSLDTEITDPSGDGPLSLIVTNMSCQSNPPAVDPMSPDSAMLSLNSSENSPTALSHIQRNDFDHPELSQLTSHNGFGLGFDDAPIYSVSVAPLYSKSSPPPRSQRSPDLSRPPTRSPPPPGVRRQQEESSSSRPESDLYSSQSSSMRRRSSTQISIQGGKSSDAGDSVQRPSLTVEDIESAESSKKRLDHRFNIVKEFINTEAIYMKDMTVVQEIYKGTAEACPKLSAEDIATIFRNTDQLVQFSTKFLDDLKAAASSIYVPRGHQPRLSKSTNDGMTQLVDGDRISRGTTFVEETETREEKDRRTSIAQVFIKHFQGLKELFSHWLKSADDANRRLIALQPEAAVQVWLSECDLVAKDLTQAWALDALLVKPFQRLTRYPLLLDQLLKCTPADHPDCEALQNAVQEMRIYLQTINESKKESEKPGKANRKRKESDVKIAFKTRILRRTHKTQGNDDPTEDDEEYIKLKTVYAQDFLNLQIILRDVEHLIRQASEWVSSFLRFLSSMELIMRMSPSNHPEIESKWARFNMSMRDMGTVVLGGHMAKFRTQIIQPIESVITAYNAPGLMMKKRNKRRADYEKAQSLRKQGKKVDSKLQELVDQYESLNKMLINDLPKLSQLTTKVASICSVNLVHLENQWYYIWVEKLKALLESNQVPLEFDDIIGRFALEQGYNLEQMEKLGILRGQYHDDSSTRTRGSQSTTHTESSLSKEKLSNLTTRSRNVSIHSERSPSLPTPDFAKRVSGQFTFSPITCSSPSFPPIMSQPNFQDHSRHASTSSPATLEPNLPRTLIQNPSFQTTPRPGTGRSATSDIGAFRGSTDYSRSESVSTYGSRSPYVDGLNTTRPHSGIFHSAVLQMDGADDSQRSSRASSRDRGYERSHNGFSVLYLAASLFEFNINTVKTEAGYPYLTYTAGEVFDVIGEKGELWLAKNQDDSSDEVGWIWSKHFAKLATDY